ncbi:hypothetical protein IQ257_27210, partial [Coleofasciculus sp. LEGE 07092]
MPSTTSTAIQPWSAEADADKLMDDLFADIDRILDGSSKLPTEPVKPDYVSLQSIVIPPITMPPAVVSSQNLVEQPPSDASEETEAKTVKTSVAQTTHSRSKGFSWSVDKVLLIFGVVSIAATIILLLTNQKKLTGSWWMNAVDSSSTQNQPPSVEDYKFGLYVLRSLELINSKAEAAQRDGGGNGSLNSSAVPGNRAVGVNPGGTVLERIYYPVYPPQTPWIP